MVGHVTIEHGLAFAQGWYEGDMSDACDSTGIMKWPDGGMELRELHMHFHDLTDEICANVFDLVKQQIAEAFVSVANGILRREDSDQRTIEARSTMSDKPFSRRSPQTEYTTRPDHYENDDIAHVMAHVRFMDEFMDAIDEREELRPFHAELHCMYMDLLADVLAPYALDLALSLIALEDAREPAPKNVG